MCKGDVAKRIAGKMGLIFVNSLAILYTKNIVATPNIIDGNRKDF